jgi:hypothetical protein
MLSMRNLMSCRPILAVLGALALAACSNGAELGTERAELGNFQLGHNIVVAANAQLGPLSRETTPEAWQASLTAEVDRRFGRYEGDHLYHIAINVEAYVLALPGVPIVLSPKSALIFGVTLWDDEEGGKVNETPHRITVLESLSGETVAGSGLTQTAEQQMENLSRNAAYAIERWLSEHPEWFPVREAAVVADAAAVPAPAVVPALVPATTIENPPTTAN